MRLHEPNHPYRVRGIPAGCNNRTTRKLLKSILGDNVHIRIKSLALDADDLDLKVATVTFEERPLKLVGNHSEWRFSRVVSIDSSADEYDDRQEEIIVDTHFRGFTSLNSFKNSNLHLIDCVAKCGLGGHAFCSFQERGGHFMWLRDGLPHDIWAKGLRVYTYGYNSQLANSTSFQSIEDLASIFRIVLSAIRRTGTDPVLKPLVVIAHSLRGIILKEAMIQMSKDDQRTLASIYHCLLFEVPSQGMNISTLWLLVDDQHNAENVLAYLGKESAWLRNQSRRFVEAFPFTDSIITCFYETEAISYSQKLQDGTWKMRGDTARLVNSSLATQSRPWENEAHHNQAINRNHSDLVKYAFKDQEYLVVLEHLRRSCGSAEYVIRSRLLHKTRDGFGNLTSQVKSEESSASKARTSKLVHSQSKQSTNLTEQASKHVTQFLNARYIHWHLFMVLLLDKFGANNFSIQEDRDEYTLYIPRFLTMNEIGELTNAREN